MEVEQEPFHSRVSYKGFGLFIQNPPIIRPNFEKIQIPLKLGSLKPSLNSIQF